MTIAFDQPDNWYQNSLPLKTTIHRAKKALEVYREDPRSLDKGNLCIVSEGYRYDEGSVSVFLDYDGKVKATTS